jgi:chromosome segregation ATPase
MIQVEEIDAQKALAATTGLSASLLAAINTEIADKISQNTQLLHEQIQGLKRREQEALDALALMEDQAEGLAANLKEVTEERDQERSESTKAQAAADHAIAHLQQSLVHQQEANRQLHDKAEMLGQDNARTGHQLAMAEAHAIKLEKQCDNLRTELEQSRNQHADVDKRAAVEKQKAADLHEALMKAESRIAALEEKRKGVA